MLLVRYVRDFRIPCGKSQRCSLEANSKPPFQGSRHLEKCLCKMLCIQGWTNPKVKAILPLVIFLGAWSILFSTLLMIIRWLPTQLWTISLLGGIPPRRLWPGSFICSCGIQAKCKQYGTKLSRLPGLLRTARAYQMDLRGSTQQPFDPQSYHTLQQFSMKHCGSTHLFPLSLNNANKQPLCQTGHFFPKMQFFSGAHGPWTDPSWYGVMMRKNSNQKGGLRMDHWSRRRPLSIQYSMADLEHVSERRWQNWSLSRLLLRWSSDSTSSYWMIKRELVRIAWPCPWKEGCLVEWSQEINQNNFVF